MPNFRPVHVVFFFSALPFPLRFLLLDVTLCHSHGRYAALSISIIAAPLGPGGEEVGGGRPNLCLCVQMWLPLHQRGLPVCSFSCTCALSVRLRACACFACVCVFSVVFSSTAAIRPSAVCPSLKHQLVSEGPLGEKETTGRLHSFFYPHKDVPLLPVLSFFQEVFAVRGFCFFFFPLCFTL